MSFTIAPTGSASLLLESLIPPGTSDILVKNLQFTGNPACAALFSNAGDAIPDPLSEYGFPDKGFVLSTGKSEALYSQDSLDSYYNFGGSGDLDIAQNSPFPSFDACVLEFEFSCDNVNGGTVSMTYSFGSDDYKEVVNEGMNSADIFGILLNDNNMATVPGTTDSVGVYTINHINEPEYFVDNEFRGGSQPPFPKFEPDGFTHGLTAEGVITPGWNKMKIGIVDIQDGFSDSAVFIEEGASFACIPDSDLCVGNACGDPHFRTFDNQFFSYHGQCDLVLTRSKGFDSGIGLDVHIRTTRVNNPHMDYSYISGAAVRIGTNVLEVSEDGALTVNGKSIDSDVESYSFDGDHIVTKSFKGTTNRIIVYKIDLGNEKNIEIRANTKTGMLFIDVNGAYADSEGLLGAAPGEGKPLLARDGSTDLTGHWNSYGEEWQVNNSDPQLFQDSSRHPQYPNNCEYTSDVKSHMRRRLVDVEKVSLEEASGVCAHLKEDHMREFCVNDIMATGDLDLVEDPFYSHN
jgi:hypothetical protein